MSNPWLNTAIVAGLGSVGALWYLMRNMKHEPWLTLSFYSTDSIRHAVEVGGTFPTEVRLARDASVQAIADWHERLALAADPEAREKAEKQVADEARKARRLEIDAIVAREVKAALDEFSKRVAAQPNEAKKEKRK